MYDKQNLLSIVKHNFPDEWQPDLDSSAYDIILSCDSLVEKLYLLGATYYLEQERNKHHSDGCGMSLPIRGCEVKHTDHTYDGIFFQEPWGGWAGAFGGGPGACALVPQLKFVNTNYHHDFGLFYSADNGGGNWGFQCAIEIDPEFTHADRRDKDAFRDSIVDYDVIRVHDTIHKMTDWFKLVIERDDKILEEYLRNNP